MRKILFGFMGLMLTVAVTAGSAYALFSDTVTLNNVAISAGTADLKFSVDGDTYVDTYTFPSALLTNVFPGQMEETTFWLMNDNDDVSIDLSARLISATGDWNTFADIVDVTVNGEVYSLSGWNQSDRPLNLTLDPNEEVEVTVMFKVDSMAGNEISGKQVSTNWIITGTQSTDES